MEVQELALPVPSRCTVVGIIESPAKVKKRQNATRRQLAAFRERTRPNQERIDRKLKELFPDLPQLPS